MADKIKTITVDTADSGITIVSPKRKKQKIKTITVDTADSGITIVSPNVSPKKKQRFAGAGRPKGGWTPGVK